jgi:hypothetical protein
MWKCFDEKSEKKNGDSVLHYSVMVCCLSNIPIDTKIYNSEDTTNTLINLR